MSEDDTRNSSLGIAMGLTQKEFHFMTEEYR